MRNLSGSGWIVAAVCLAACGEDRVEPLQPLQRPSPEARAGLPEVRGRWLLAGWEVPAEDTAAVTAQLYRLLPPGEFRVLTQRMDSVAGQYGVPGEFVYPFAGEVRRDGILAGVLSAGEGVQQFFSGRVVGDTFWLELSSLPLAAAWPPRTRVAFARRVRGAPFTRLLGGRPLGPDSATLAALRRDSLARAAALPGAAAPVRPPPAAGGAAGAGELPPPPPRRRPRDPLVPPEPQPVEDTGGALPAPRPPRADTPRDRPPPQRRDTPRPPREPQPPPREPEVPQPPAPRDTLRIGTL